MSALERLGRVMAAAVDSVRQILCRDYAITIIARHKSDPYAHVLLGDDDVDGIAQFVSEMAAAPNKLRALANADFCSDFGPYQREA